MKKYLFPLCCLILCSCYKTLEMDGFDKEQWRNHGRDCSTYRLEIADHILENQNVLLEATQNEVESLLGAPREHELYQRNQKYFHYRLSPPDSCGSLSTIRFLSIRFNAIGRANLVQVMLRDPQ